MTWRTYTFRHSPRGLMVRHKKGAKEVKIAYGEQKRIISKRRELIKKIDDIASEYDAQGMTITVRQIYYQLVARNIMPNSKDSYEKISDLVADGRMLGLLDWDMIEDRTRFTRGNVHFNSPKQGIKALAEQYRIDTRATQPCYVESWIEKDSLVSILEETCRELDVPCFSCRGYPSITALHEAADRFRSKENAVILYAGDHDPSGLKIPQVIKERFEEFEVNVKLHRIGLTREQIEELNLPPFPAKQTDKNYAEYVKNTGLTQAWELDALPPEKLSAMFESAINSLTDFQELERMREIENEHLTYFSSLCID